MAHGHGGKRPGAGRPRGSRNALTMEQKATLGELARAYTEDAIKALAHVCREGSDAARVAAANALLDRGYGRPIPYDPSGEEIEAPTLTIHISKNPAVADVRVTQPDG